MPRWLVAQQLDRLLKGSSKRCGVERHVEINGSWQQARDHADESAGLFLGAFFERLDAVRLPDVAQIGQKLFTEFAARTRPAATISAIAR